MNERQTASFFWANIQIAVTSHDDLLYSDDTNTTRMMPSVHTTERSDISWKHGRTVGNLGLIEPIDLHMLLLDGMSSPEQLVITYSMMASAPPTALYIQYTYTVVRSRQQWSSRVFIHPRAYTATVPLSTRPRKGDDDTDSRRLSKRTFCSATTGEFFSPGTCLF